MTTTLFLTIVIGICIAVLIPVCYACYKHEKKIQKFEIQVELLQDIIRENILGAKGVNMEHIQGFCRESIYRNGIWENGMAKESSLLELIVMLEFNIDKLNELLNVQFKVSRPQPMKYNLTPIPKAKPTTLNPDYTLLNGTDEATKHNS